MASESALVPSIAAPRTGLLATAAPLPVSATMQSNNEPEITKSLKRNRPDSSPNSAFTSITDSGFTVSPLSKSPRFGGSFLRGFSPAPLTGVTALEDERRKKEEQRRIQGEAMSENPTHKALSTLMAGGGLAMSKPQDGPAATTAMSEGLTTVANAIRVQSPTQFDDKPETSPTSATSLGSLGSVAQTATASTTAVASPMAHVGPNGETRAALHLDVSNITDEKSSNRALSFPGNVLSPPDSRAPLRGMSLPMSGVNQQLAPRSPSHKKHKCPYCDTEFTRHHNLKSHLLTHSQEKPYVCQTCQMRFRRLHDLKRHTKLHTGERPHICPKCDRKFARGDALARHAKGQGGCAGRRASTGSFGGDEDYEGSHAGDDSGMDNIIYAEPGEHHEGEHSDEERRFSLPSIKAQHVGSNRGSQDNYTAARARTPSTYPPAGPRPRQPMGGLFPPNADHGSGSSLTSSNTQNTIGGLSPTGPSGGSSMFAQSGMTESPKPLSPSAMGSHQLGHDSGSINRQRSPSLTTQFQQQHFGRRQSGRSSPQGMGLPSTHGPPHGPKLPAIPGLVPPESRFTLTSQGPGQPQPPTNGAGVGLHGSPMHGVTSTNPMYQPPMAGQGLGRNAPQHQGSSGDSSSNMFSTDRGIWMYVQGLEERVKQLSDRVAALESNERAQEDKISQLFEEVGNLRAQAGNHHRTSNQGPSFGHMQQ